MSWDNARHKRYIHVCMYVRREKLDIQLRVPCWRDVIFSCWQQFTRERTESSRELGGGVCVARAPSFSRSRGDDGKIDDEHVCVLHVGSRRVTNSFAKPVSYIFHVPICASVCITRVHWCPSEEFCHSKEKCFYSIFFLSLSLPLSAKTILFLYYTKQLRNRFVR